mgnify:FL=1
MSEVELEVWAPGARTLDVVSEGSASSVPTISGGAADTPMIRTPMIRSGKDTWTLPVEAGTLYRLSPDGRGPFPDPRSRHQPQGVHGPSQAIDLTFSWTDQHWRGRKMLGEVWQEIHIGTFTKEGTFDSAITALPHLAELGIGVVEVMPVPPFPGDRGWGYDGVSLFAVHAAYGGPEAMQRFVDAAHSLGMAVALDAVYNHLGPSGNYLSQFGPYFTDRHHTPWGEAINLDGPGSPQVRQFLLDNAKQWFFDFHVDALRLDAVHALRDDAEQHFLAELAANKRQWEDELGRPLLLVAESDLNDAVLLESPRDGGYGLDGQWDDDFHHALHAYVTGERFGYYVDFGSAAVLADVMKNVFLHRGGYSTFRERNWGRPVPESIARDRFVVSSQNHDQVGNRAMGDRPDERLTLGQTMASAALLLLSPFTPMLFQGQEWATRGRFQFFTDHGDDIGPGVKEGRQKEFASYGWESLYGKGFEVPDPQDASTFVASKLDWDELETDGPHRQALAGYQALIALRDLIAGDNFVECDYPHRDQDRDRDQDQGAAPQWFVMRRSALTVWTQVGDGTSRHREVTGSLLWSFGPVDLDQGPDGQPVLVLGPHSVAITAN